MKASQEKSPHIVTKSISNFWGNISSDKTPVNTRILVIDLSGALISIFCKPEKDNLISPFLWENEFQTI